MVWHHLWWSVAWCDISSSGVCRGVSPAVVECGLVWLHASVVECGVVSHQLWWSVAWCRTSCDNGSSCGMSIYGDALNKHQKQTVFAPLNKYFTGDVKDGTARDLPGGETEHLTGGEQL